MFEIFDGIPMITFFFSILTAIYMLFAQDLVYSDVMPESSVKNLMLAYCVWAIMAMALKWFVIDSSDFSIKSVFTYGPFLGFVIYLCINSVLYVAMPNAWTIGMFSTDVVWGTALFSIVTLIVYFFKQMNWLD